MMSAGLSVGEITLREIDFAFPAQLRQVTLRDEHSPHREGHHHAASGERVRILRGNLLWMSRPARAVTEKVQS